MAATAAAIVSAALPVMPQLINLIASLVHHQAPVVEVQNGPGTGPVKFADLFSFIKDKLSSAVAAGQIALTSVPDDVTIQMIMQAVVSSMQLSGFLTGATPPSPVALDPVTTDRVVNLKAGQTLLIQVK